MSVRKRAKALFSAAFAVATLGAGASLTLPGVASAHTGDLHANAVCNTQTGQYDVTYTLTTHSVPSGVTGSTMWRIGTASFQGTPNSASGMDRGPVASSGNQTVTLGTESLPGNTVNGPWVYAFTTWSNGTTRGSDGRVEGLAGNCVPPPISDEEVWFDYEVPCGVSEVTQTGERRSYDWVWSNGEMTRQLVGIEPISRIVAVESEPCPVLGIVVTDLPCAGPDGATVQFTVTYNGVDNKFSVIALRDGVMPIGGPEVTLVNGVGMGSISLPAGEYTLRAYHEYASDIIPPADVNLMVDDCDDEPTGSMTGWEDCAVGTPTAFFQFIGFGEGDHSVSYTVDGGRSFVDVNWNGDSSPVQSHAAEAGEDSVYIYAESDGFPEGWAEYTVGIDDDCAPPVQNCRTDQVVGSVANWLKANGFDGGECFSISFSHVCGTANGSVTSQPQPGYANPFRLVWREVGGSYQNFPALFAEDYNGGSVTVEYFIVGPESDWLKGVDSVPNIWTPASILSATIDTDCEDPPTTTVAPIVPDFDVECAQDGNGIVVTSRVGDIVVVFPAGSYPSMVIAAGESKTLPPVDGIVLYLADDTEYIIVLADVCVPAGPTTTAPPVTTAPPTTQPPSTDPPVDTSTTLPAPPTTVPPTPPAGELPATGAPTAITAIIAFVTILGGFGLLAVSRRRTA